MSDTQIIAIDEIEPLATEIDGGDQPDDDDDKVVLRALLVLAGEPVADLAGNDVEGFAFDTGPQGIFDTVGLHFPAEVLGDATPSVTLFRRCCNGEHHKKVTITAK